jgi:hypothetical protein
MLGYSPFPAVGCLISQFCRDGFLGFLFIYNNGWHKLFMRGNFYVDGFY